MSLRRCLFQLHGERVTLYEVMARRTRRKFCASACHPSSSFQFWSPQATTRRFGIRFAVTPTLRYLPRSPSMTPNAWRERAQSAAEVVAHVQNGQHVFVHGAAATPLPLIQALQARSGLEGVQLYHLHLGGGVSIADPTH